MRRIARAAAVALLLASGCHLAIAPGDTTTDADAQRSVWACLDSAIAPAIDRAAQGPGWAPDFCERGCGGRQTTVLARAETERRHVYSFRCVRDPAEPGAVKSWPLPAEDYGRILGALYADLLTALRHAEAEVTAHRLGPADVEIDYRRGEDTGSVRLRIGSESAPEGVALEYTRIEVDLRETTRGRLGVTAHGPLISLLRREME